MDSLFSRQTLKGSKIMSAVQSNVTSIREHNPAQAYLGLDSVSAILTSYAHETDSVLNRKDVESVLVIARATAHLHDLFVGCSNPEEAYRQFSEVTESHIPDYQSWDKVNPLSFLDIQLFGQIVSESIQRHYTHMAAHQPASRKKGWW